ncbi:MAG TPA: Nif3-like dinuclear metal center hexameric protein [Gemmatimonadaceae bacterium]|nr:Nif3-like dinuclear metal center hexameric protein [Gemmatimonadaceae bacterium]
MPTLADIARFCDDLLGTAGFPDSTRALNGIQVDCDDDITKIAAAVDARERTIAAAHAARANLLLVHHGLFWGGLRPLQGPQLRRFGALLRSGIGVYAAHLPLDAHPDIGNGALLAGALGLTPTGTFGRYMGVEVGVSGQSEPLDTAELVAGARAFAAEYGGSVRTSPVAAGRRTERWGVITGAGASSDTISEAAERGIDTMIVGEGPHHTAIEAEEAGIVIIYAGHYATEALGVQALATRVAETFRIPWVFVHEPTGL